MASRSSHCICHIIIFYFIKAIPEGIQYTLLKAVHPQITTSKLTLNVNNGQGSNLNLSRSWREIMAFLALPRFERTVCVKWQIIDDFNRFSIPNLLSKTVKSWVNPPNQILLNYFRALRSPIKKNLNSQKRIFLTLDKCCSCSTSHIFLVCHEGLFYQVM